MVDEEDGGVEGDSQCTQCGENGGDLAGVIFIGALEAYERIKDQQLGALAGERKGRRKNKCRFWCDQERGQIV